jgi:hypothetical protein
LNEIEYDIENYQGRSLCHQSRMRINFEYIIMNIISNDTTTLFRLNYTLPVFFQVVEMLDNDIIDTLK